MWQETSLESSAKVGTLSPQVVNGNAGFCISQLAKKFIPYVRYELGLSDQTAEKYRECLDWVIRDIGDLSVMSIDAGYVTMLKQKVMERGAGERRLASIVFALRGFLKFCQEALELPVMDYKKIKPPKIKRREVVYLTAEEIQQFVSSIKLENSWDGNVRKRCVRLDGLRFRTLVEVLLGTGMRISEALSLNRDSINFEKGEAKIIGKGNKERTVYFTDRSLEWIRYYLENRQDDNPALFLNQRGEPLNRGEADFLFMRYGKKSGINKKISPHTIRHSFATLLLQNGCPVGHLKELLGHTDLQVTCKYYLGIISKAEVKQAHSKYLNF